MGNVGTEGDNVMLIYVSSTKRTKEEKMLETSRNHSNVGLKVSPKFMGLLAVVGSSVLESFSSRLKAISFVYFKVRAVSSFSSFIHRL